MGWRLRPERRQGAYDGGSGEVRRPCPQPRVARRGEPSPPESSVLPMSHGIGKATAIPRDAVMSKKRHYFIPLCFPPLFYSTARTFAASPFFAGDSPLPSHRNSTGRTLHLVTSRTYLVRNGLSALRADATSSWPHTEPAHSSASAAAAHSSSCTRSAPARGTGSISSWHFFNLRYDFGLWFAFT